MPPPGGTLQVGALPCVHLKRHPRGRSSVGCRGLALPPPQLTPKGAQFSKAQDGLYAPASLNASEEVRRQTKGPDSEAFWPVSRLCSHSTCSRL